MHKPNIYHQQLRSALQTVVAEQNGGFGLQMWVTIVDRDNLVQLVAYSGEDRGAAWPGSRVISAQKAYTANAFSLPGLALSTANLYTATQPGGSLYGLQHSNPVNPTVAYANPAEQFGQENDPMVGQRIGGVNIFGGGLALYDHSRTLVGALGVSGDSSTADHIIAWKLRHALELDYVPGGISPTGDDNMVNDIENGISKGGWGHPTTTPEATDLTSKLPTTHPVRKK